MAVPRQMTAQEQAQFHAWFPSLNVTAAVVTGEATRVYNCISWTVGVTNSWLWPGPTIQQFDAFYARYGLRRASSGPVAAWGISTTNMTHGCVSGSGHGPRWESKCGASLRIQHGLNELVSSGYGRVLAFYGQGRALSTEEQSLVDAQRRGELQLVMPTQEQIAAVKEQAAKLPSELTARFERLFDAWKRRWDAPEIIISSDPRAVTHVKEFHDLVALGKDVLPVVVEKLVDPENFFALQLYDALQPEHHMIVGTDLDTDQVFEGEQGRSRRTVERYASSLAIH